MGEIENGLFDVFVTVGISLASGCMSREIAMCTTSTSHAAADFCAAVILCSHSQWCSKFVLGQTVIVRTVVEEAMAATNSGPSDKALSIS